MCGVSLRRRRERGLPVKQHVWAHGKVLRREKTLVRDDFRSMARHSKEFFEICTF